MGNIFQRLFDSIFSEGDIGRILMIGLDNAGKTTTLYHLKLGEVVQTTPTIGFNVETVEYKGIKLTVWDIGGQDKIRALWRHYYTNSAGIIFVIDSCDKNRLDEATMELSKLVKEEELAEAKLLILANKQDMKDAMSVKEITDRLGLNDVRTHQWFVQPTSALKGDGLLDGLEWLSRAIRDGNAYQRAKYS